MVFVGSHRINIVPFMRRRVKRMKSVVLLEQIARSTARSKCNSLLARKTKPSPTEYPQTASLNLPMRFCSVALFYSAFLGWLVTSHPLYHPRTISPAPRDLLGLLGGGEGILPIITSDGTSALQTTPTTTIVRQTLSTSEQMTSAIVTTTVTTAAPARSSSPPAPTTRFVTTSASFTDPATVTFSSASIEIGYVADAPTTPPAELTEWKVIGIAVITITFIGTVILAFSFFDSWWGFVCDAFCGGRGRRNRRGMKHAGEELIPDWEKRSWEFRLASEDGHRYPTMSSLESIAKEKDKERHEVKPDAGLWLTTPEQAYGGKS